MENLMNVLQMIIDKYNINEEDVAILQEALSALEMGGAEEFGYEEPEQDISEEPVEE